VEYYFGKFQKNLTGKTTPKILNMSFENNSQQVCWYVKF
jgi:hypothetical protein